MEHEPSIQDGELEGVPLELVLPKPVARVLEALVLRVLTKLVDHGIDAVRQRRAKERQEAKPAASQEQAMRERISALGREVATLRARWSDQPPTPACEAATVAPREPGRPKAS